MASDPKNWMLNGTQQKGNPGDTVPGAHASDVVTFDPGAPNVQNGNADIYWDYKATFSSMNVGGQMGQGYSGAQTINSGIKVEMTGGGGTSLSMFQNTSRLRVYFGDNTSIFQMDNDADINSLDLGTGKGLFQFNGGISTIAASPGWIEQIGTHLDVAKNAILTDLSYNPLTFTTSNAQISIEGIMYLSSRKGVTTTLVNSGPGLTASSGEYINVNGGWLKYAGNPNVTNTIEAPIIVQNSGRFYVSTAPGAGAGTRLIVQGETGATSNASVDLSSGNIYLSTAAILEADNDYLQNGGTLQTSDNTMCSLQDGPNGSLGTAVISGGGVQVDTQTDSYGTLKILGGLTLMGYLEPLTE